MLLFLWWLEPELGPKPGLRPQLMPLVRQN